MLLSPNERVPFSIIFVESDVISFKLNASGVKTYFHARRYFHSDFWRSDNESLPQHSGTQFFLQEKIGGEKD